MHLLNIGVYNTTDEPKGGLMADLTQIKCCPHCGGTGSLNSNYSYKTRSYFVFVKCGVCGATGKVYGSTADPARMEWDSQACNDAIAAWNMRIGKG